MDRVEEMRRKFIDAAKKKVQEKYEEKDVHIIKSVNILEDLDPIANLLIEQLREWHAVHFPELDEMVADNDHYIKLVNALGKRESFTQAKVKEQIDNDELAAGIFQAAQKSIGSSVSDADMAEMRALALNCMNLRQEREYLSKYLEQTMKREMPNFCAVAGPVIGAKILAKAGSKRRLALLPASTIQVIGAEKALFLHFKKGVSSPKHGYLYQHPLIKAAKQEDKGRLARTIASKLAIAAKIDYFGGKDQGEQLARGIEGRAKQLHGAEKKSRKETKAPTEKYDAMKARGQEPKLPAMERFEKRGFERKGNRVEGRKNFEGAIRAAKQDFGRRERPAGRDFGSGFGGRRFEGRSERKPFGGRKFEGEGRGFGAREGRRPQFGQGKSFRRNDERRTFSREGGGKGRPRLSPQGGRGKFGARDERPRGRTGFGGENRAREGFGRPYGDRGGRREGGGDRPDKGRKPFGKRDDAAGANRGFGARKWKKGKY